MPIPSSADLPYQDRPRRYHHRALSNRIMYMLILLRACIMVSTTSFETQSTLLIVPLRDVQRLSCTALVLTASAGEACRASLGGVCEDCPACILPCWLLQLSLRCKLKFSQYHRSRYHQVWCHHQACSPLRNYRQRLNPRCSIC